MGRGAEREAQRIDNVAHALLRLPMLRIDKGVVAARQRIRGKESTPRAAFSGLANGSGTGRAKGRCTSLLAPFQHGVGVRPFA